MKFTARDNERGEDRGRGGSRLCQPQADPERKIEGGDGRARMAAARHGAVNPEASAEVKRWEAFGEKRDRLHYVIETAR